MQYHPREVKAGLLVVAGFITFIIFIVAITGIDWERKDKTYTARFSYIGGIERGAMVRYGGLFVGEVTDLYLAPDDNTQIEVVLTVDARTPVRKTSVASIASISIMSEYYIEISPGASTGEMLESGKRLIARDVPPLTRLSEPFMNVSEQLALLLVRANDLMNDANRQRFSNLLANADSLFETNAKEISGIVYNLNALTEQMQSMSGKLDKIMGENSETLQATFAQMNQTMSRADSVLQALHQTMNTLNGLAAANQRSLNEAMENLQNASQHFEQFSRTIKERPWNLIRKSAPADRELP
jgi:phospholipid/cholesterol/gamma-HCH transport system substrate-binding protein